ncbi:MetQ/NlpA family ABC transporter substrate-binding protein [uncultured Tessaracoccus sp.]|uniref:MetQ/NlpA family ABC transporter substrate-binding protein n=1 Tax=uncultured Tessaracoccus sp. TaxID=905023 RepID=UPI0025D52A80|nr:MetQ/NlpA family ABC transporter substrate-binding protein [uncultured Tessaracoccus sp.]
MRKLLTLTAASLAATLALAGCAGGGSTDETPSPNPGDASGAAEGTEEIIVGASPVPHAKILEYVRDNLAVDAGLTITIKEFDDYVLPNQALADGELDANFYQHLPFLEQEMNEKGYEFEHGEGVHIEPLRLFAKEAKKADELPDGATVAITNDVSNQARGLKLLEKAGLLKDVTLESSVLDLSEEQNPKGLQFEELQPDVVVQMVEDPKVDAAIVNANFVLGAGLDPDKAILSEEVEGNPYANLLVWRADNEKEGVKKLDELLHSDEVKQFVKKNWPSGDVLPG